MIRSCILAAAAALLALGVSRAQDYKALGGAALKAYEKSAALSEAGNAVSVSLSGDALCPANVKVSGREGEWRTFEHRGVTYVFDPGNPYVEQAQRKLTGKKSAQVLVKGKVTRVGPASDKKVAVVTDTAQAVEKKPAKPKKKS